jgi:hypothetical protein
MDSSFWLRILIGLVVGGGGVWYFKLRSLQVLCEEDVLGILQ